jgi:hypothetical protein
MNLVSRHRNNLIVVITSISAVCIVVFLIVPLTIKTHIRQQLITLSKYRLNYSEIRISPLSATCTIEGASLSHKTDPESNILFRAKAIEFALCNTIISQGRLTGKINVVQPEISFITSLNASEEIDFPWENVGQRIMSLPLHELRIINGKIIYEDRQSFPTSKLVMDDINIQVNNLDAQPVPDYPLVSHAEGNGNINGGKLNFSLDFNPVSKDAVFCLKASLEKLDLTYLSDYLKGHGNLSIENGMFSMVAQASGQDEEVSGFVKPLLENIHFASLGHNESIGLASSPFIRPYPKISFQNDLNYASLTIWSAVTYTMRSAFFEALMPVIKKINSAEKRPGVVPKITPTPANAAEA